MGRGRRLDLTAEHGAGGHRCFHQLTRAKGSAARSEAGRWCGAVSAARCQHHGSATHHPTAAARQHL
eukprot:SAG31_NODE_767_length_12232_cov_6.917827_2_plen_67_part_00